MGQDVRLLDASLTNRAGRWAYIPAMLTRNVVLAIVAIPLLGSMGKIRKESLPATQADSLALREAIERGARGFMRGDPDSILAHYAPDVILSYPGIPDQDYATLARGYAELRNRPSNVSSETRPSFDEILVSGNLAVVRLRWTTTTRVASADGPARETVRRLRDLQVWRRESTGEWRFIRGMHYPDSTATSGLRATVRPAR